MAYVGLQLGNPGLPSWSGGPRARLTRHVATLADEPIVWGHYHPALLAEGGELGVCVPPGLARKHHRPPGLKKRPAGWDHGKAPWKFCGQRETEIEPAPEVPTDVGTVASAPELTPFDPGPLVGLPTVEPMPSVTDACPAWVHDPSALPQRIAALAQPPYQYVPSEYLREIGDGPAAPGGSSVTAWDRMAFYHPLEGGVQDQASGRIIAPGGTVTLGNGLSFALTPENLLELFGIHPGTWLLGCDAWATYQGLAWAPEGAPGGFRHVYPWEAAPDWPEPWYAQHSAVALIPAPSTRDPMIGLPFGTWPHATLCEQYWLRRAAQMAFPDYVLRAAPDPARRFKGYMARDFGADLEVLNPAGLRNADYGIPTPPVGAFLDVIASRGWVANAEQSGPTRSLLPSSAFA
jgi:hypothetical protein